MSFDWNKLFADIPQPARVSRPARPTCSFCGSNQYYMLVNNKAGTTALCNLCVDATYKSRHTAIYLYNVDLSNAPRQ